MDMGGAGHSLDCLAPHTIHSGMRDILTRHDDLIIVGTTPTGTGMDEIYYVGKTIYRSQQYQRSAALT